MALNTSNADTLVIEYLTNSSGNIYSGSLSLGLLDGGGSELSYSGYARQSFQYSTNGSGVATLNNYTTSTDPIDFPAVPSGAGAQTAGSWALIDGSGNIVHSESAGSVNIPEGDFARIAANSLQITVS